MPPVSINRTHGFSRDQGSTTDGNKTKPTAEKSKYEFSWIAVSSLGVSVFAAVLFGAGKAYRNTYLWEFGFDGDTMPWSFQDLVYLGIIKLIDYLLITPLVAIAYLFAMATLIVLTPWFVNRLAEKYRRPATLKVAKTPKKRETNNDAVLEATLFLINYLGAVAIFTVIALFFAARAERLGKEDSKKELDAISVTASASAASKQVKPELHYAIIDRIVEKRQITEEGYIVTCSDRACGLYNPNKGSEKSRLVPLDHLISFRYVRKEKS